MKAASAAFSFLLTYYRNHMDKSIEQLQDANNVLTDLLATLASAKSDLRSWELHDMDREDGSAAQDARHNDEGDRLKEEVWSTTQAVKAQISALKKLGDSL